jgi:integrase
MLEGKKGAGLVTYEGHIGARHQSILPGVHSLPADASAMLAAGADLKSVSERLCHASIAITMDVYTVVAEEKQREASERLAEVFGIGKK